MEVRPATWANYLDRMPPRRSSALVHLSRLLRPSILRAARCPTVRQGRVVRVPALLRPDLCKPARSLLPSRPREKWGRKPLLLLGFGLEIIRALLFAFSGSVPMLLIAQFLGRLSRTSAECSQPHPRSMVRREPGFGRVPRRMLIFCALPTSRRACTGGPMIACTAYMTRLKSARLSA